ncbi:MAG: malate dehydrogenase [Candidatus Latescibacteria bacterium]|nr:malate dehydrogenase [Candidatus Latescibacterota bacterium]
MMNKVSIIGAGQVGAATGLFIAQKQIANLLLVDVVPGLAQGKALDLSQAAPVEGYGIRIAGTEKFAEIEGSEVVVVTAGVARRPGMSRLDLLEKNASIVKGIAQDIAKYAPLALLIMVTNPLDLLTYLAWKVTGFPPQRILGQAGILDTARFRHFVAQELGVSAEDVSAMVLGGHGDTMVPLPRYTCVSGVPVTELLSAERIAELVERTRRGGAEIVALLKTGSASFAPGAAAAQMVEAILRDQKRILPCSAYLQGEYGIEGVFVGVPVRLGAQGVEEVLELKLTSEELKVLRASAEVYRQGIEQLTPYL